MNNTPVLKTPGEMIAEARESRELTIAELSERTKIPPRVLASLEMDEYHKISGPLYIKSFLRTCAMDLGLDPEVVLSLYNKISGEKGSGTPGAETVWGEEDVQVSRIGLPWLRITIVVGLLAVTVGLVLFALRGCSDGTSEEQDPVETEVQRLSPEEAVTAGVASDSAGLSSRSNSMIAAETEAELREMAEDTIPEVAEPAPASDLPDGFFDELAARGQAVRDSLLQAEEARNPPVAQDQPVDQESEVEAPVQEVTAPVQQPEVRDTTPEPVQETLAITGNSTGGDDAPPAPGPFMESSWPLVLSITCEEPLDIKVKRDGDREFSGVRWPAGGQAAPPVPDAGFEAGRAYAHYETLVVFWGAEDHFSIILESVRGVEVAINGSVHDISRLKPGQELILDAYVAGSGARR